VTDAALTAGFQRAFLVGGCFALVGAVIAVTLLVGVRHPRQAPAPAAAPASGAHISSER
jgi:hypothetical protein